MIDAPTFYHFKQLSKFVHIHSTCNQFFVNDNVYMRNLDAPKINKQKKLIIKTMNVL